MANDPRLERNANQSFLNADSLSSEEPIVETNTKDIVDLSPSKIKEMKEMIRQEKLREKLKYLREYKKSDSQKALYEHKQKKLPAEIILEK